MSKISELSKIELEMGRLRQEADALRNSPTLQKEIQLRDEINEMLNRHEKKPEYLLELFPQLRENTIKPTSGRSNRRTPKLKIYLNPHTQERIETRGGNQKQLKEWKAQHGSETVEGWVVGVEE